MREAAEQIDVDDLASSKTMSRKGCASGYDESLSTGTWLLEKSVESRDYAKRD